MRALLFSAILLAGCGGPAQMDAGAGGGSGGGSSSGGGSASGGGTASGGGGGGSATGGGAGCVPAPLFTADDIDGKPGFDLGSSAQPAFNFANFGVDAGVPGLVDWMSNELFIDGPLAGQAIAALDYANCDVCLSISLGCDDQGNNCRREFLAQSGTISVDHATKSADAGTFSFHLDKVSYAEWDFLHDRAVPDGGCLSLTSFLYSGVWP